MSIDFKYQLKQHIWINELACSGTVRQQLNSFHGIQYAIRYFDRGDAKEVWFYEDEISVPKFDAVTYIKGE